MKVRQITNVDMEKVLNDTEITLLTKKTRKEIKVYVSWFDSTTNILCGWYTNRFGKLTTKQFNMNDYDFYI